MSDNTLVSFSFIDPEAAAGNQLAIQQLTPYMATKGASGYDISSASYEPIVIMPSERRLIPSGIALEMSPGLEAQIRPRSGLAHKHGITVLNAPGTIDSDYRGEIKVLLINLSDKPFIVERGMRIAQLVFNQIPPTSLILKDTLSRTGRQDSGFCSTGIHSDQKDKK